MFSVALRMVLGLHVVHAIPPVAAACISSLRTLWSLCVYCRLCRLVQCRHISMVTCTHLVGYLIIILYTLLPHCIHVLYYRCVELSCYHWRETSSMFPLHLHCNRWQESSAVWRVQWRPGSHEWCLHHWLPHYGTNIWFLLLITGYRSVDCCHLPVHVVCILLTLRAVFYLYDVVTASQSKYI